MSTKHLITKYCIICGQPYQGVQQSRSCARCKPRMVAMSRKKNTCGVVEKKEKPKKVYEPIDIVAINKKKRLTKLIEERYHTL